MPPFPYIVEISDFRGHQVGDPPPLETIRTKSLEEALAVRRLVQGEAPHPDLLVHVRPVGSRPRRVKPLLPGAEAWPRQRKGDAR